MLPLVVLSEPRVHSPVFMSYVVLSHNDSGLGQVTGFCQKEVSKGDARGSLINSYTLGLVLLEGLLLGCIPWETRSCFMGAQTSYTERSPVSAPRA